MYYIVSKKYTDIEELTVPMINEYIEKVVVHEATGGRQGKDKAKTENHKLMCTLIL